MTLALKKYILQGEIIQFPPNEGISDMELSVLCTWAFPLRGHLVHILSFRDSSIKYTMNIQAKKVFCNAKRKKNDGRTKKYCKLLLCSKEGVSHMCTETKAVKLQREHAQGHLFLAGSSLREASCLCNAAPAMWKCRGKDTGSQRRRRNPPRATTYM